MNQTSSDMSQNFTIGDLAYDVQLQALRHGKRMEFLTLCESKIVAYLFRNPGRHISSDELLRIALGNNARRKTTVVETRICYIRKKIAAIRATTTIRTNRHRGYIIE